MKIIKLSKKDYSSMESMLKKANAVFDKMAYPSHVYVSPNTYKKMDKAVYAEYKKAYPHLSRRALKASVGMYMLNLSPNILKGLQDDVMLIDTKSIGWERIESITK